MTEQNLETSAANTRRIQGLFAADLERLLKTISRLKNSVTESDIHEYRVAITVLTSTLNLHSNVFKRLWVKDLITDLVLLSRLARKARSADVMYQQVLAFSLDSEVEVQAALQSTISRLNDKRQAARTSFADVIETEGFGILIDSVAHRLGAPNVRRSVLKLELAALDALLLRNSDDAVAQFKVRLSSAKKNESRRKLHQLRLSAKKVRYALDSLPGETDVLDLAREAQGTLGSLRDAESLVRWLEKWRRQPSVTKLERHSIRAVVAAEELRVKRLRQKFKKLRKAN